MMSTGPILVLFVDGSPLYRRMIASEFAHDPRLHVVGGANDPNEAREQILRYHPDIIVLDLDLPGGDALALLQTLREAYPVPVIVYGHRFDRPASRGVRAMELGAFDAIAKPCGGGRAALCQFAEDLAERICVAAAEARPVPRAALRCGAVPDGFRAAGLDPSRLLVVVGASTGGTEAIAALLSNVPADFPPMVLVQHMPVGFTRSFAERLNGLSCVQVREATEGERVVPGQARLARGDTQLTVQRAGAAWVLRYTDRTPVNRHCPSVDVLFRSAATAAGRSAIGILLTGMGDDGADGMSRLRAAGALTVAQDARSCVVYGMPKAAVERGAVQYQATPGEIPGLVLRLLDRRAVVSRRAVGDRA